MKNIKKLGLGIVAFEGTEHIKNILYEIKDYVDTVVVCLQEKSYDRMPIDKNDVETIKELKKLGYVDHIIWFKPTNLYPEKYKSSYRYIETDKRNYILDYLENKLRCSHSLIIDSDEFYNRDSFKNAKNIINENPSFEINYCEYINYYKDYQHLLQWPFISYVPFITRSCYRFNLELGNFNQPSDPTRRYVIPQNIKCNLFDYKTVQMHHFSFIRLDISKKINLWSAKKFFNVEKLYEKVINSYNNFKDGDDVYLYFNIKDNKLKVNKLIKPYVNPRFKLNESPTKYEKRI